MSPTPRFLRAPKNRPSLRRKGVALAAVAVTKAGLLTGVAFAAPAAFAATTNPTPSAGARKNATRLSFPISGTASLSVDVATGNALFTDQLLTLPGVRADVPVTLSYNSSVFGTSTPSAVTGTNGSGWAISGFDQRMVTNSDNSVTYYGPGGLSGVFTPSGSAFTSPSQFQATLTGTQSSGYTLTDHTSQEKLAFNSSGRLTTDTDRDGNITTYAYNPVSYNPYPTSITTSRWNGSAGSTVTITANGSAISTITETSGYTSRSVSFGYSTNGHLASVTDTAGGVTGFQSAYGTDTGQVVTISNPDGKSTTLSYATGGQVSQVSQANPAADNGAGTSTTRLTYPTTSQTLVADPTTNQSVAVASVAHTTYAIKTDGSNLVASATDPDGNKRSATYTTLGDIASSTTAAGGSTTFTYGANSGESLTNVASPGGATDSATYSNTGGSAYLPSSSTDDAGNALKSTYDSNGNQTGTQQGTSGPSAKVTYNNNGTAATSASPGAAAGVTTNYTYDSIGDLTKITPVSGTTLGSRAYTYDGFGRVATATDGKGDTITYTYDNLDRITKVAYSDGTTSVSYTYDKEGHVTKRVDASGTTTYTYDDLGHLLTTSNSANGNTVTSTYDLAGALATSADAQGTTTYSYDAAHQLTQMAYPQNGSTDYAEFANNGDGKRTDVWLQSNSEHTVWAAHEHFTYDNSGRISTVLGQNGPATGPTTVENETLCYAAGAAPTSCTGTPTSADRSNIQSTYEAVSGESNTYTYDDHNRLTKDVVTGGSNPRTYTYGYDAAGNRTSSSVTGSSPTSQTLAYNAGNQISSTGYTYDGAGNLATSPARTATFNAAGQQTSATVSGVKSTYTYAGTNENEVLSESVPNDHTYTLTYGRPDKNGLPEVDSVKVAGLGTGYIESDPSGQPVLLSTSTGVTLLYLYDGIHNPVALSTSFSTTAQAYKYDPYGVDLTTTNPNFSTSYENPYTFGEGLLDRATHEVKFGQRFYNPTTGNWTQQDALNAPLDPGNANRYEYAADNPINNADPNGQGFLDFVDHATSAVFGAVAGGVYGCAAGEFIDPVGGCAVGAAIGATYGAAAGAAGLYLGEDGSSTPGEKSDD